MYYLITVIITTLINLILFLTFIPTYDTIVVNTAGNSYYIGCIENGDKHGCKEKSSYYRRSLELFIQE